MARIIASWAACICAMASFWAGVSSDISCSTNDVADPRVVQVDEDGDRQQPADRLGLHRPCVADQGEEAKDDREDADEVAERPGVGADVPEAGRDPEPDRREDGRPDGVAPLRISRERDALADEGEAGDPEKDERPARSGRGRPAPPGPRGAVTPIGRCILRAPPVMFSTPGRGSASGSIPTLDKAFDAAARDPRARAVRIDPAGS